MEIYRVLYLKVGHVGWNVLFDTMLVSLKEPWMAPDTTSAVGAVDTVKDASRVFLNYGVLGAVCLLLIAALVYLYRNKSKDQQDYVQKLEALLKSHSEAYKELINNLQEQAAEHAAALKAMSKDHADNLAGMAKEHKAELHVIEERYIKTFENTTNKYYELQKAMMEFMIELKQTVKLLVQKGA